MTLPSNDFLEFLNLYLGLLDLIVVIVFARYLLPLWPNWHSPWTKLAIGLSVHFTGISMIRLWTWAIRFGTSHGVYVDPPPNTMLYNIRPIFLILMLVNTVGVICIMRQVSIWKNNWGWAAVAVAVAILSAIMAWVV